METPDFDKIAAEIHSECNTWDTEDDQLKFIREQLDKVWNARGAADRATIHDVEVAAVPLRIYSDTLERALLSLDR